MSIDPGAIKALVEGGGWAVVVAMILAAGVGVLREWWVPGWIYRRSEARADRNEAALRALTQEIRRALRRARSTSDA